LEGEALQAHLIRTVWRPPELPVALAQRALEGDEDDVVEALGCLAEAGPVVLVVPWAKRPAAVLRVVEALVRRPGQVLVAMSMRDEEAVGRPELEEALRRLETLPAWTTIAVEGLSRHDLKAVVSSLVALESTLLERVVERAKGNAAYAVSLVKHWQVTGALSADPRGWTVTPAAEQTSPPSPASMAWLDRLAEGTNALEQLAVLGSAEDAVWVAALGRPLGAAVARLKAQGVVRQAHGRWFIAAPAVADALLARAVKGGRRLGLQQAAADALQGREDAHSLARRGRHLLAVGRAQEAMRPLLEGAKGTLASGERLAVLAMALRAMWAAGVPASDRRWLALWAVKIEALHEREHSSAILEMLPEVEALAEALHDSDHRWRGPFYRAVLTERDPRGALRALVAMVPEGHARGHLVLQLAWYELLGGGVDACEALIGPDPWADDEHQMLALELRSEVARRRGDLALALSLASASASKDAASTSRLGPSVWCQLGDLRRITGDLDGAKTAYAEAAALARRRDSPLAAITALNVLIVRFEQGETLTLGELEVVRRGIGEREASGRIAVDLLALALAPDDELPARTQALLQDAAPSQPELWLLAQRVHARRGGLEALVAHLAA
jgi:hypothetical protein